MKKLFMLGLTCLLTFTSIIPVYAKENKDTITISFAGDFTLGTYKGQGAGGRFDEVLKGNKFSYFLENVENIFEDDDISFINLEGPFSTKVATADKSFPISCNPESVNILTEGGIDVVSLANNHTLDCGTEGLTLTKKLLDENDIDRCNIGEICIIEKEGFKVAFLGEKGFSNSNDVKKQILDDINKAKNEKADIIIIMFHWGVERDNYNNSTQQDLAYMCIDEGVDIVVGSHPHVIQGIEIYKDCPIVYSMGNFCFGANKNPKDKDSFIFQQDITKEHGKIKLGKSKVIPCSISSTKIKNDYKPTPLEGTELERVLNRLTEYSKKYNTSYFD